MSRVSCRPSSIRSSMTVVVVSGMRDVTWFMDPKIGTRTQYTLIRPNGWEPQIVFGSPTGRSGLGGGKRGSQCVHRTYLELVDSFNASDQA